MQPRDAGARSAARRRPRAARALAFGHPRRDTGARAAVHRSYFSGGVDSSLLAARLSQLGRHDVRLVNYCFGREDTESPLAARVASHLGLECHQVRHELREVAQVLERVDRDYSFPFGDLSTIPTNILVHGSLSLADESRTVIEGTGADGAFGFGVEYRKWQRLYA